MSNVSRLIYYCTMDLEPELTCIQNCIECEHLCHAYLCPICSTKLSYDYNLDIKTGSVRTIGMFCEHCNHTE